ncbi:protein of unknown function (DUF2935) [Orenia metallireducens]|uniref:DUF2935 domain-containing protein n=1 Tax=Orenia metallireducens TaxID=1413210 RepID=A0A285HEX6_9FIRM|nr:DUF2935 domain-containing protein [Orenia metallireducens]PRX27414.1 protein of unknown function (DUF2935) [Orenia metallireducens]SNY34299.1 protein of unknown function [Orenia metallireducens]
MQREYLYNALFEHRFWLQILGDHSRFIYNSLSPKEYNTIEIAKNFIDSFDSLLNKARESLSMAEVKRLNETAYQQAIELRGFKLDILESDLISDVSINMTPTFINHMVNELERYLSILEYLIRGEAAPVKHPIESHLLWLQDAYGHSASIQAALDFVEQSLQEKSGSFTKNFRDLHLKAIEFSGYLRTGLDTFPALSRFNRQVKAEMELFQEFLQRLKRMEYDEELLGNVTVLLTDHMYREECYYLTKLAQVTELNIPKCDPTQPREQE